MKKSCKEAAQEIKLMGNKLTTHKINENNLELNIKLIM